MKGEADPSFHYGDQLERHPAIAVGEAVIRAIRSDLHIGGDLVCIPKIGYETWVS